MNSRVWLKKTLLRLIITALVCAFLIWLAVFLPANSSKSLIYSQIQSAGQSAQALQEAGDIISSSPRIEDIQVHRTGAFRSYSDTLIISSKILNKLSISYNVPSRIIGFGISYDGKVINSVNEQIKTINLTNINKSVSNIKTARSLMDYQSQVAKALVNILEYDPAADMAGFSLGSEDTDQRLTLAKNGLSKTISGLDNARKVYSDPSLNSLTAIIKKLQAGRDKLASSGDVAGWIDSVNSAQQIIISNRKAFWDSQAEPLKGALTNGSLYYSRLEQQWRVLKQQYAS